MPRGSEQPLPLPPLPPPRQHSRKAENNGVKSLPTDNETTMELTDNQIQEAILQAIEKGIIPTHDSGYELGDIVEALVNSGKAKDIKHSELQLII